ncbi:AAA family ATPase [Ramlibacter sp. PS4R-6]|uniref:AAA family ATPase n=1 Tax=Ramlibacter sp. PS4R-6 TaxID=3133438 RepID=UPI00309FFBC2
MLHSYSFTNLYSFAEKCEVSLVTSHRGYEKKFQTTGRSGDRLNLISAFMGANAAGKTAALKALVFVTSFVKDSFHYKPDQELPFTPHFAHVSDPSQFEVIGEDADGVLWRYELTATKKRVLRESLHRKARTNGPFVMVFERSPASDDAYVVHQDGFGLAQTEAEKVRPNASLLATAAQYNVPLALALTSRLKLNTNINSFGRDRSDVSGITDAAEYFAGHPAAATAMTNLVKGWDLGINGVKFQSLEMPGDEKFWLGLVTHVAREGKSGVVLLHQESAGTQGAIVLLSKLLPILETGGLAVIDELDGDLHPHMLEPILGMFASTVSNPKNAQLLFTCHMPEVLTMVEKSQVHFFEKVEGESVGFRGDTIEGLRSDDNLRAKYMAGALGAVPIL